MVAADAALPVTAQTLATALQTLDALQQNRLSDAANGCFRAKMNTDALVKQLLTISGV